MLVEEDRKRKQIIEKNGQIYLIGCIIVASLLVLTLLEPKNSLFLPIPIIGSVIAFVALTYIYRTALMVRKRHQMRLCLRLIIYQNN